MFEKFRTTEGGDLSHEMRQIIKQTVRETVVALRNDGLLRRADDVAYAEMSARLYQFYRDKQTEPEIESALAVIGKDAYFDILPLFFREKYTVEQISEIFGCDISTVTRNKKKLCLRLHGILST